MEINSLSQLQKHDGFIRVRQLDILQKEGQEYSIAPKGGFLCPATGGFSNFKGFLLRQAKLAKVETQLQELDNWNLLLSEENDANDFGVHLTLVQVVEVSTREENQSQKNEGHLEHPPNQADHSSNEDSPSAEEAKVKSTSEEQKISQREAEGGTQDGDDRLNHASNTSNTEEQQYFLITKIMISDQLRSQASDLTSQIQNLTPTQFVNSIRPVSPDSFQYTKLEFPKHVYAFPKEPKLGEKLLDNLPLFLNAIGIRNIPVRQQTAIIYETGLFQSSHTYIVKGEVRNQMMRKCTLIQALGSQILKLKTFKIKPKPALGENPSWREATDNMGIRGGMIMTVDHPRNIELVFKDQLTLDVYGNDLIFNTPVHLFNLKTGSYKMEMRNVFMMGRGWTLELASFLGPYFFDY